MSPLRMLQRCESDPQQSDFVSRADHVPGVDTHGDLLDVRQILVKLGQQSGGGVLLEPEDLTGRKEEENSSLKQLLQEGLYWEELNMFKVKKNLDEDL